MTASDVADVLAAEGFTVDKRKITIAAPIDALGSFTVSIRIHPAVSATMKLWVVAKKQ